MRSSPGLLRLDLHMHTWGSFDCLSDPERVLRRARERGVGRIAITDHDRLEVAFRMAERHPDHVIAGEEVKTAEGVDVIGLYLREPIPGGTPAREVCRRVREQGGIVYLPHPYAPGKGGSGRLAEELAPLVDVVEVFNARLHPESRNEPAEELARRHGTLRGAGSDAHTVGEVAGAWVEVPEHPNEPGALREALADLRRIQGREASRFVHLASTWAKVRKKLPGAPGPRDSSGGERA
ncbi:MAG TPA: PHP-associated domain-containing protein [Longimicrobiales bacterium]|nr:PHP-associated domain-containing protein [Longimicrobiales bacterium]